MHSCNGSPIEQSPATPITYRFSESSILGILDHLSIEQLGRVADENTQLIPLISQRLLIAKYRVHEKVISIAKKTAHSEHSIEISEFGPATRFLRLFGTLITKLQFSSNDFTAEEAETINRHIAQFGEHSITTLALNNAAPDDVYFFSHVLRNVQSLTISSRRSEWNNYQRAIHFASVKHFTLFDHNGVIWNEAHLPITFGQLESSAIESAH